MKKPKQKPKCKRIISRLKTNPKDWFMYVCPKCGNWYDEVDYLAPYHNEYSKCYKCDKETMSDDKAIELLREVMRFRKGEGKYDFSKLEPYDEANALTDAWDYIELRIQTLLYERDTYKDSGA